jgi:hypothetical protein
VYRLSPKIVLALLAMGSLIALSAAGGVVGTALSQSTFRADDARVSGSATLLDGSTIETEAGSSQVRLKKGGRILLAPNSRATVFGDRIKLDKGSSQLETAANFRIEARGLQIMPESSDSKAVVSFDEKNRVLVAALHGSVRVAAQNGMLLAAVSAGNGLSFDPQAAGASAPTTLTGCLEQKGNVYVLRDETTGVTYEVRGANVARNAGNRVEVTGAADASASAGGGASQVINTSNASIVSKGCFAGAGAASGGAAAGAGAAAAAGGLTGKQVAVIAGVIVAGAGATAVFFTAQEDEGASP